MSLDILNGINTYPSQLEGSMLISEYKPPPKTQYIFNPKNKTYVKGEDNFIKNSYIKRFKELFEHLESLKLKNVINDNSIKEILLQFSILELRRDELSRHIGEVVVVCNGELFFGESLIETIKKARAKYGKRPHYSESIDMVEYPSIFE